MVQLGVASCCTAVARFSSCWHFLSWRSGGKFPAEKTSITQKCHTPDVRQWRIIIAAATASDIYSRQGGLSRQVVFSDRLTHTHSYTCYIECTCRAFCHKYVVFQDKWSLTVLVSQERFHYISKPWLNPDLQGLWIATTMDYHAVYNTTSCTQTIT